MLLLQRHLPADSPAACCSELEALRSSGKLLYYGLATWDCFRQAPGGTSYLSLAEVVVLAAQVGGPNHGFRFVQLPINAAMPEAWSQKWQVSAPATAASAAASAGCGAPVTAHTARSCA